MPEWSWNFVQHVHTYACMYVCMYVCMYICMHVAVCWMYVRIYACMLCMLYVCFLYNCHPPRAVHVSLDLSEDPNSQSNSNSRFGRLERDREREVCIFVCMYTCMFAKRDCYTTISLSIIIFSLVSIIILLRVVVECFLLLGRVRA